ncbi:MAG: entericidin A/B family lipoprotein [Bdellovibrionales bacterium]|jgi:predicted small secreted protein|nr:entericidin A/B family lipoprotein [Bdellovibrionales bacterium]
MKKMMKLMQCLALAAVLMAPLAACNTMEGLGRDTKAAGEAITGSAKENKSY